MLHGAEEAWAQAPVAVGPEFRVNTYTTEMQRFPGIAMDDDGDFVIVWDSKDQDGDDYGIFGQRFDASGVSQGDEFKVNTFTNGSQRVTPEVIDAVSMDGSGNFVIVWDSRQDGGSLFDQSGVYAQRFNFAGEPIGNEFRVNSRTTGSQRGSAVAMDDEGNFVVAWRDNVGDDFGSDIFAQIFDLGGNRVGSEFRVNNRTEGDQFHPSVDMNSIGEFVISWNGPGRNLGDDIYARKFDNKGAPVGSEFVVDIFSTDGIERFPTVAISNEGSFVIAWGNGLDGSGTGIFAACFDSSGEPIFGPQGYEFLVNTWTTRSQFAPSAAMDQDGDFVIAWESFDFYGAGQDGSGSGIFAQRYDSDCSPVGSEFQVNTSTQDQQSRPSVAIDADGDFAVTWISFEGGAAKYDVYAQRYAASSVANEDEATLPAALTLDPVFPNPVRDAATLRYALPTPVAVRLSVTDVLGRTVLTRAEGVQPAGEHEARLALDDLPSGVYVVRLDANGATATQRVTVVR
ncbi:MAG: T9SS type A sorting domain-containing protein [Bacteroidota bacterium]